MKIIAISIIAFAMMAVSFVAAAAVLRTQPRAMTDETCVGLGCWPATPPIKHRPGSSGAALQPVW